jgi:hypothetical protein
VYCTGPCRKSSSCLEFCSLSGRRKGPSLGAIEAKRQQEHSGLKFLYLCILTYMKLVLYFFAPFSCLRVFYCSQVLSLRRRIKIPEKELLIDLESNFVPCHWHVIQYNSKICSYVYKLLDMLSYVCVCVCVCRDTNTHTYQR